MAILQLQNVSFTYPQAKQAVLNELCADVEEGTFVALCGASGCGKSTLLKLLKREIAPYGDKQGRILFDNKPIEELDERSSVSQIGIVMQDPDSQIVTDTVWHEMAFGLESLGYDNAYIRRRVAEIAAFFGIEQWFHCDISTLSGGQKQLLNLASVMVMGPKVLLLDEPTAQLDPIAASQFIATLHQLHREIGLTVILAEHRLEEVFPVADRVWLMEEGRLVYDGAPRRIHMFFKDCPSHSLKTGLPAAMRIFSEHVSDHCPLTVQEGRQLLAEHIGCARGEIAEEHCVSRRPTVMELKHVFYRYEQQSADVLRDLSFCVYEGEHVCLLGGNGVGKTTLLGVLSGTQTPYRGKVLLNNKTLRSCSARERYFRNIALLPQDPKTVFLEKTVREDLLASCLTDADGQTSDQVVENMARRLGIESLLDKHPFDLSGGELQKTALAKVLLTQPKVLLLDEPTKGLDAGAKQELIALLKEWKASDISIVTVTHDVEFAAQSADRCTMVFDGNVVSEGTPTAFFCDNLFYTTAAHRISRGYFKNAILCEQVETLYRKAVSTS